MASLLIHRIKVDMEKPILELPPFTGLVWRIKFADQNQDACGPVKSPMGRFHYSEQVALNTSFTDEGARVAIHRYLKLNDPARVTVPLQISADRIYDIRKTDHASRASVVWQNCVAKGERAPTWKYSDTAFAHRNVFFAYMNSRNDLIKPTHTSILIFAVSLA